MEKISAIVTKMSTRQLVLLPLLASLIPIIALVLVSPDHYSGTEIHNILIDLIFFLWGLSGIPVIIRKETVGLVVVRGGWAVIQGIVMTIIPWTLIVVARMTNITK